MADEPTPWAAKLRRNLLGALEDMGQANADRSPRGEPAQVIAQELFDEGFGDWIDHIEASESAVSALERAGFRISRAPDEEAVALAERLRALEAVHEKVVHDLSDPRISDEDARTYAYQDLTELLDTKEGTDV